MGIDGPLKWHGGKGPLASKIVALMPPRCKNPNKPAPEDPGYLHFVEPYAGGLSVLLANDPEGISEVANDINRNLTNFWRVLQDENFFANFHRLCETTPFSEIEWQDADDEPSPIAFVAAHRFFVRCRQSMAGRMKNFPPMVRTRTRRGMQDHVSAWLSAVEGLSAVHERLKRVAILNRPAVEVIHKEDGPRTLFYLDPPYYHPTRATTTEYGEHEMDEMQHRELLATITHSARKSRFMLSGYDNDLYRQFLGEWTLHTFDVPNNAAGGKTKDRETECLWCNF